MVSGSWPGRLGGAAAGLVLDRVAGEPPVDPHPLAVYGTIMDAVEERLWQDSRVRGVAHATTGVAIGAGIGALTGPSIGCTCAATYLSVGGRGLADAARAVSLALACGELDAARDALPALVGRDPSRLDETEIARAVVESVAENTVDAVVAPALWAALAGGPGTLGYRAVNTLDAMVGHHNARYENYGWASARLDDAANYGPARVTAALAATCRPRRAGAVVKAIRRDAPAHPSPNAGVAEAAFAAVLGVQLGGTNHYGDRIERRAPLGDGRPPRRDDIERSVRLSRDITWALAALLAGGAVALVLRRRRGAT